MDYLIKRRKRVNKIRNKHKTMHFSFLIKGEQGVLVHLSSYKLKML